MKTKKRIIPIVIVTCVLIIIAVIFFVNTRKNKNQVSVVSAEEYFEDLASKHQEVSYEEGVCFVNNRILVLIENPSKIVKIENEYIVQIEDSFGENYPYYAMVFNDGLSYEYIKTTIQELEDKKYVDKAWMDYVLPVDNKTEVYPNDPWGGSAWDVSKPNGKNWNMEAINAPSAWGLLDTDNKVKVGIIDSGIDKNHEDLKNNIVNSTTDVEAEHGTEVTGIIAAEWNNVGISGLVGKNCEIYEVYAYSDVDVYLTFETFISYFTWLIDYCDVQVINYSQGYKAKEIVYAASQGNKASIKYCNDVTEYYTGILKKSIQNREKDGKNDFVICCSSGNEQDTYFKKGGNWGYEVFKGFFTMFALIPKEEDDLSRYGGPLSGITDSEVKEHIIVVGAVGHKKRKGMMEYSVASYSNRGSRVDVLAPGTDIYTTEIGNKYSSFSGTSFAAPHVSGLAAMLFAMDSSLSAKEVKEIICTTGLEKFHSGGKDLLMIDANEALKELIRRNDENADKAKEDVDYSIDYDRKEWAYLLTYLRADYDYRKETEPDLWTYWDLFRINHWNEIEQVERKATMPIEQPEVSTDYAERISKERFDLWLCEYFDIDMKNTSLVQGGYAYMEEDETYYYMYFYAGYGLLYDTFAYIYDTSFSKDEAVLKAYILDDYYLDLDDFLALSREGVLLDRWTNFQQSKEFYFDIKDGRLLLKGQKTISDEKPYQYVGKAIDSKYSNIKQLKMVFEKGTQVQGYEYSDDYGSPIWRREGWEGYIEYYGPDYHCSRQDETDEPIYVVVYENAYGKIPNQREVGVAVFADNSMITYYEDGHVDYFSYTKRMK